MLDALRDFWQVRGYAPTFAELATMLGWKTSQKTRVRLRLHELRAKGQAGQPAL